MTLPLVAIRYSVAAVLVGHGIFNVEIALLDSGRGPYESCMSLGTEGGAVC